MIRYVVAISISEVAHTIHLNTFSRKDRGQAL